MEIVNVEIKDLKLAEYNPREISDKMFDSLKNSIKEFGFVEPVVVNKDNTIIGGHMRVRAFKELGMSTVPVVYVDLPDAKAKLLNLALNKVTGGWDVDKLSKLITELTLTDVDLTLSGFDIWELNLYNLGQDSNLNNTWKGMPEFSNVNPREAFRSMIIHFENQEALDSFSKIVEQDITDRTKYIWYPKREKEDIKSLEFKNE